jgi:hypothetical protein
MRITTGSCVAATTAAFIAAVAGCTDFEAPVPTELPDVVIANPSFARDIQPIFTARCATASCHNLASQQLGLNLQAGYAYDEIVSRGSSTSRGMDYVHPFRPDSSWLVRMIGADAEQRFQLQRMPLGREPLTGNQIATIVNWVSAGAPRN